MLCPSYLLYMALIGGLAIPGGLFMPAIMVHLQPPPFIISLDELVFIDSAGVLFWIRLHLPWKHLHLLRACLASSEPLHLWKDVKVGQQNIGFQAHACAGFCSLPKASGPIPITAVIFGMSEAVAVLASHQGPGCMLGGWPW